MPSSSPLDLHDYFSSLSHLFMAVCGLFGGAFLLRLTRGHAPGRRWAVGLYAAALVVLYTASGLFHGVRYSAVGSPEYHLFRRFDQSAIFLLVAGSCLPLFAYLLSGAWRIWCSAAVGALAAAGIATLWVIPQPSSAMLVAVYAALGVVGVIPARRYVAAAGWRPVRWLGLAALLYIAGGVFEVIGWPVLVPGMIGPHEVLHVFDMAATGVHFGMVVWLALHPRLVPGARTWRAAEWPSWSLAPDAIPTKRG